MSNDRVLAHSGIFQAMDGDAVIVEFGGYEIGFRKGVQEPGTSNSPAPNKLTVWVQSGSIGTLMFFSEGAHYMLTAIEVATQLSSNVFWFSIYKMPA